MLLGNYTILNRNTGRATGNAFTNPAAQNIKPVFYADLFTGDDVGAERKLTCWPHGYSPSASWSLPQISGGIAAHSTANGSGSISATIAGGVGVSASIAGLGALTGSLGALAGLTSALVGSGVMTASIAGVINATANLLGTGTVSNAAMGLLVGAVAALSGVGSLSASIGASINAAASLTGTGSVTAAMTAVSGIVAALVGSGSLTATPSAKGQLSAAITVGAAPEVLSPSSLAAAVWNALAADFDVVGSMGEAQGAGGSLTPTQSTMLLEMYRLLGLDPTIPLVVTATARSAGAIAQTIAEAPAGTVTVTRQ